MSKILDVKIATTGKERKSIKLIKGDYKETRKK